ncbi:MAG: hypothetical protein ACYCVN_14550 [Acidimicrobiales bacterium]
MTTLQTEYTEQELLASHPVEQPLMVGDIRCHGGFDSDGVYRSPRTRYRWPAIQAWETQRRQQFATPILEAPLDTWPEHFPNVEQAKLLIRRGAPESIIATLTRIGTLEGFGGMLRHLPIPDFGRCFSEEITGTAISHIGRGLIEAHARDEAGFEGEAGHNGMWYAARDLAFEDPAIGDETDRDRLLRRLGVAQGAGGSAASGGAQRSSDRILPVDIEPTLEALATRMIGLLFIEISAFHSFRWAEAVLADSTLVAGEGEAARIVSYIRSDEAPHVAWLQTALTEMRDRTWVGERSTYPGSEMVNRLWERALVNSVMLRRQDDLDLALSEIEQSLAGRLNADDILEELLALGSVTRGADGRLHDPTGLRPPP